MVKVSILENIPEEKPQQLLCRGNRKVGRRKERPCEKKKKFPHLLLLLLLLLLLSRDSRVQLCVTPQTAAHQAPPSLGFSRQEHWSVLPFPSLNFVSDN